MLILDACLLLIGLFTCGLCGLLMWFAVGLIAVSLFVTCGGLFVGALLCYLIVFFWLFLWVCVLCCFPECLVYLLCRRFGLCFICCSCAVRFAIGCWFVGFVWYVCWIVCCWVWLFGCVSDVSCCFALLVGL